MCNVPAILFKLLQKINQSCDTNACFCFVNKKKQAEYYFKNNAVVAYFRIQNEFFRTKANERTNERPTVLKYLSSRLESFTTFLLFKDVTR